LIISYGCKKSSKRSIATVSAIKARLEQPVLIVQRGEMGRVRVNGWSSIVGDPLRVNWAVTSGSAGSSFCQGSWARI
jgi:hypothetical protein